LDNDPLCLAKTTGIRVMITLNNLSLQRGAKILFQSVSLSFYDKYKVGIVGKNGSP
jgi:ATPase subunit of ABC transporter with duplicated ATPase domains